MNPWALHSETVAAAEIVLEKMKRPSHFRFREMATNTVSDHATWKPCSLVCPYCGRNIHAWGKRKKGGKRHSSAYPQDATEIRIKHQKVCCPQWLHGVLCRWSTKTATHAETEAVDHLVAKIGAMISRIDRETKEYNKDRLLMAGSQASREAERLAASCESRDVLISLFDALPQPVGSEYSIIVEVMLSVWRDLFLKTWENVLAEREARRLARSIVDVIVDRQHDEIVEKMDRQIMEDIRGAMKLGRNA